MLKWLIALTSLFSAAAVAAVWTWVDEQGHRHFSDQPVEGATQVEVAAPQTFRSTTPSQTFPSQTSTAPSQTTGSNATGSIVYTVLDIVSPGSQETLHNIGGSLTVEVATYPALQRSDQITVYLDGERQPINTRQLSFTVPNVVRGEHTLAAAIVSADGAELIRSAPVTFFVQQRSGQQPLPQTVSPARPSITRPRTAPPPRPRPTPAPN